jgi:hypothetical protein
MLNRLDLNARYYLDVHNGRAEDPVEVQTADEVHLGGEGDGDSFYLHKYLMPAHSSACPIFQDNNGDHQPPDDIMMAILQKLDESSRQHGLVGDDRPLVTWVVFGVDSWSTSPESPRILVTSYPYLRHRITMAMPHNRVDRIPYVFQERHHTDDVGLAWAHFDVEVVSDIQGQLEEDPKAPIEAIRRDQAALLHFLRQVQNWKDTRYLPENLGKHYGDRDSLNFINAKGCEIGEELMKSLKRNYMSIEGVEKKCSRCQRLTTSESWHRCQQNLGDVVCQDCYETELEDPVRTPPPPKPRRVKKSVQNKKNTTPPLPKLRVDPTRTACDGCKRRKKTCVRDGQAESACNRCRKLGSTCEMTNNWKGK